MKSKLGTLSMKGRRRLVCSFIEVPVTLLYICKLNEFVARNEALEWGVLRTGNVGISGTDYVPPVPDPNEVEKDLTDLLSSEISNTEKAITAFLWGGRRQMFWEGNKRTSLLLANKILVANRNGILSINERNMAQFNELLVAYYNTNDMHSIKLFLYENAISGIDFKTSIKDEHHKIER